MSSPHLNNLIIVGCLLTYSSVVFLGLDSQLTSIDTFPYICTARAWLLMAGFSLAFGAMFSKTWRVHSIFTDVKLNKKVIKDYQLFMVVGVLLAIDLGIMTTWQVTDPFKRATKKMEPYPHPSSDDISIIQENEYCMSERMTIFIGSIYAYKGLLMIFGAFLAWETRHVSIPALNDSKYVGMSVYNVVIMCVMGAAVSFVLSDKQEASFVIISVFILFCTTATLCLVFVPKIVELRRNPQGAIDKRMIRATLRPMSKRRDSTASEMEERIREAKAANAKKRKLLLDRESELQMLVRRLSTDGQGTVDDQMDRLAVPRLDTLVKKDVPSATETTDVSSLCSGNSSQEGVHEKRPSQSQLSCNNTLTTTLDPASGDSERAHHAAVRADSTDAVETGKPLSKVVSFSDVTESTGGDDVSNRHRDDEEEEYYEEEEDPRVRTPPVHRHSVSPASGGISSGRASATACRRRSTPAACRSPKAPTFVHQEELWLSQRPSRGSPAASPPTARQHTPCGSMLNGEEREDWSRDRERERHRARERSRNRSRERSRERSRDRDRPMHYMGNNSSTPNVLTAVLAEQNQHDGSHIHRAASERGRDKCCHHHHLQQNSATYHHGHRRHQHSRASSEEETSATVSLSSSVTTAMSAGIGCSTVGQNTSGPGPGSGPVISSGPSALPQVRAAGRGFRGTSVPLTAAQSSPDVARPYGGHCVDGRVVNVGHGGGVGGVVGGSGVGSGGGVASAVSEGELLDLAILPIFQKLLTERHKSRRGYGASIASCPNISIKCDIVEYL